MDTKTLIADAKARFAHNSAKDYLREKYDSKFLVADQGGLFKADSQTIALLHASDSEKIILIDTFNNPVEVDRKSLLMKLGQTYTTVMTDYYNEWKELENKR
jgi:hypothetical protein